MSPPPPIFLSLSLSLCFCLYDKATEVDMDTDSEEEDVEPDDPEPPPEEVKPIEPPNPNQFQRKAIVKSDKDDRVKVSRNSRAYYLYANMTQGADVTYNISDEWGKKKGKGNISIDY